MKKLLILLLCLSSMLYAQTIDTLVIPKDYNTLVSKYKEMAGLYLSTKADLTSALKVIEDKDISIEKLTSTIEKDNITIDKLSKDITILTDKLQKADKYIANNTFKFFRHGVSINYGIDILTGPNTYSAGYRLLIKNKIFIGADAKIPAGVSLGFGYYFN